MEPVYTPHLKKVLKTYQASATNSLHGPNSVLGAWSSAPQRPSRPDAQTPKPGPSSECDFFEAPPPFPIQQPPIFTPADTSRCERSETLLEGETISCFDVGGEPRLCLPQILNTVLRDFSLQQINSVCDTLHIYCSRCNASQLEVLKSTKILPCNAPSCGLITKTDAQRLCYALLDFSNPTAAPDMKPRFSVKVYHECFGRCTGLYTPDYFHHPLAPCIECMECHALLPPQRFVCHVHHPRETRTCHWGFDVMRWRAYILLEVELEENQQLQETLTEMKERFGAKYKRKQILEESCDLKRSRLAESAGAVGYPFAVDPMMLCYYNTQLWEAAAPSLLAAAAKEGRPLFLPPEAAAAFPLLHKTMHGLKGLTPELLLPLKLGEEAFPWHAPQKRPRPCKKEAELGDESEDARSDTSFSTLSAGTEDGLASNVEDEDDPPQPDEVQLQELRELLTDVDPQLAARLGAKLEALVAQHRKCLTQALRGKKLYQMELEKLHYTQRAKLQKYRERNKTLQREIHKLRNPGDATTPAKPPTTTEKQQSTTATPPPIPPVETETKDATVEGKETGLESVLEEDTVAKSDPCLELPKRPPDST